MEFAADLRAGAGSLARQSTAARQLSSFELSKPEPDTPSIDTLPAVDFGANALISQFSAQQRTFAVTCTSTEGYTLTFDDGQNYLAPWRRLRNGSDYLRYNLYHNGSSLIWNSGSPLSASGTGDSQTFTYQAILDPSQANAPAGVYTDNVLLIINY